MQLVIMFCNPDNWRLSKESISTGCFLPAASVGFSYCIMFPARALLQDKCLITLLAFGALATWFTWSLMDDYGEIAATFLYANVFSPLASTFSGYPKTAQGYCYKPSNSVIVFVHVTNASDRWLPIEACSFKLAAMHNNDTGVCVLTAYPMSPHPTLTSIENLQFAILDYPTIFNDTPLAGWYYKYFDNGRTSSRIWMWELSDALRYAYLYKYGGKYMDTDSWTLRNLQPLQNVLGWQDGHLLANGVLFFQSRHPFIEAIMENFTRYFSPGSWGSSGPYLVTRIHNSGLVDNKTYTLESPHTFYPTHYSQNHLPFIPAHNAAVKNKIQGAYALHLWRYMIRKYWNDDTPPPNGSFVEEIVRTVCA